VSGFPPATTHGRTHLAAAVDRARARRRRSTDRSNLDRRPRPMPPLRLPQPLRRRQHLHRWLVHCADSTIPELHRLARATGTSPTTGSPLLLHCGVEWHTPNRHGSEAGYHDWPRRDSLKVDSLVASTGRTGACGGTAPMESFLRPAAEDRPQPGDYQDRTHLLAGGGNVGSANSPSRALKCCSTRSHKRPESTHPPSH